MTNHIIQFRQGMPAAENVELLDATISGYQAYRILSAALEIGLFDWLSEHGPATRHDVAALGINGMFTRGFLAALADMGYITFDGGVCANTRITEELLVSTSPTYQGDLILAAGRETSSWSDLAETLRNGVERPKTGPRPTHDHLRAVAQRCVRGELQHVVGLVARHPGFWDARSMLDIGGGHGLYAIALCQENPDLQACVFDLPHVVPLTREYIGRYGMDGRVSARGGDILIDDPGRGYDLIIVSHLLYKFRDRLVDVLGKVTESLAPGGLLVLNHLFCTPDCTVSPGAGVAELDRALMSAGHPLCHPQGLEAVLKRLGYTGITSSPHETGMGYGVLFCATNGEGTGCCQDGIPVSGCGGCCGPEQGGL
jgi:predicted O-methyltransferase YrrM